MQRSRVVLIAVLVASLAVLGYQRHREAREAAAIQAQWDDFNKRRAYNIRLAASNKPRSVAQDPGDDRQMTRAVPSTYPRPPSNWLTNEKAFYEKILTAGQFDVLVIPFQVQEWAVDRATRSLMAAELADVIARTPHTKVADPYLVAKALGDGQRRLVEEDIDRVANATGVRRIVRGYVGHNRLGKMCITIRIEDRVVTASDIGSRATTITRKNFDSVAIDDEHPPIEAYESLLPEISRTLGLDPATTIAGRMESTLDVDDLPGTPAKLVTAQDAPARDAYTFLLLSALTPAYIERTKERFAEKALLALARMSKESPEYTVLRARAYMVIGFRPAAIKVLGTPKSDEEKELLAVLNGNLPDVRTLASREKNHLKRLLEKLDENDIARAYGVADTAQSLGEVKALNLPGRIWPFLAARAFTDADSWSQFDNATLKLLLDREFPMKEYSLEQIARGAVAVSDARTTVVGLSVFNHSRKYVEAHAAQVCCQSSPGRFDELDYMELLTAAGHDNLVRRLRFLSDVQGTPEPALDFANSIESVYKGYPYYAVERAKVERRLAASSGGVEGQGLIRTAFEDAFNAMYWEQAQSRVSAEALYELSQMGPVAYGYFDNFYSADIPYHPLYVIWSDGGDPAAMKANGLAALKSSTSQFYPVLQLAEYAHDEKLMAAVVQATEQRFIGNPARGEFLANREILQGNTGAALAILRENVKLSPTYAQSYVALGKLLFESSNVDEAAKTFMSYPPFKHPSGANRVGMANDAYTMGSMFFRSGDFELAKPLYRIAASQGTGAGGEIFAAMRLRLLGGDIDGAMAAALDYGQRYNDSHGFRDYFGMLHATGNSAQAWLGFNTLVQQLREPHIWETAIVGHHMAGASEADVVKWAQQGEFAGAGVHRSYATCYLARFATMDRIPSRELSGEIDAMDRSSWKMEDRGGYVVRPTVDGRSQQVLGPIVADSPHEVLAMGEFDSGKKHRVKSDLAYFVEGYRAIELGDFPAAKAVFDEAATLYDMSAPASMYMLPYYALAAAKGGDASAVGKILGRIGAKDQQFDYELADAILKGVAGKADEAVRALELARYRRPNTDDRPLLTDYTYGDICELLSSVTGNPRIRAIALEWAKKRQISEPWQSWSYALEATLSHDPEDRGRAVAMTYYLDRKSRHLTGFKKPEIDEAVRMYGRSNVFVKQKVIKANDKTI